jgi:hypothetical protein
LPAVPRARAEILVALSETLQIVSFCAGYWNVGKVRVHQASIGSGRLNRIGVILYPPDALDCVMQKRTLRIVKRTPIALGICERCNSQFHSKQPTEDSAEAEIMAAFDAHNCELVDSREDTLCGSCPKPREISKLM